MTKKSKEIDERLKGHIKELMFELEPDTKRISDERLEKIKNIFVSMFVQTENLKQVVIEETTKELIGVFSKSPKLLDMIKNSPQVLDFVNDKRLNEDII